MYTTASGRDTDTGLVINYDRICVMDAGLIAELDSPLNLYDQGGIFKGMCDRSGIKREEINGAK